MPQSRPVYSIDSSGLIHAWRRVYRPKNFAAFWEKLDELIEEGRLRASIEVYGEIEKKDDDLLVWCKERKEKLFVEIDAACEKEVKRLMRTYPRLVDTTKGRSEGDPFVIALASASTPKMKVITEERPGKTRIPDVCRDESIDCCDLADMIEDEGWKF